jgi:hypothetical protein
MELAGAARRPLLERRGLFLAAIGLLIALGIAAALRSYPGADTGFLLDEAARVLGGARLYADLVEMNPPLIVGINMAAVLCGRILGIPEILAYRVGCIAALFAALALAAWLLRRLLPDQIVLRRGIMLLLVFVLFNLPGQDFGEREHLLLMLALPYLLLAVARATGREIPTSHALVIGLVAGAGLSLKPHFVLLWLAIEGYLRLTRRVSPRAVSPETGAIAVFLGLYGIGMLVWAPEYLGLVRLLAGPYTRFLYDPFWHLLLTGRGALLTLFALLTCFALRRDARHPGLLDVFALGALVSLLAGAAQQKELRYHFYPSFALAFVLLGMVVRDTGRAPREWVRGVYRIVTVSILATAVVVVSAQNVTSVMGLNRGAEQVQLERVLPVVRALAARQGVYVMSYHIGSAYPLINYSGARSASRFPQLWIFPAAYMDQLAGSAPLRYHAPDEMSPSERYLNQAVFEDLRDQRPKVLVVQQHARDLPVNGFRRLDYVAYFRRDPRIAVLLDRYQFRADLGDFLVYERIPEAQAAAESPPTVQPATRDIVQAGAVSGAHGRSRDPAFLLALLAFVISAILAAIAEKRRAPAPATPGSARA